MGFLDKFLSKEAKKALSDLASQVKKDLNNAGSSTGGSAQTTARQPAAAPAQTAAAKPFVSRRTVLKVLHNETPLPVQAVGSSVADHGSVEYFADLVRINLPQLTASANVALSGLVKMVPRAASSPDLVLYRGGAPVLAIFLTPKSAYRKVTYLKAMNACEDAGIPAVRFMREFSNNPDYVVGRISAIIG